MTGPEILSEVSSVIRNRCENPSPDSYVSRVVTDPKGIDKILEKVGEESTEFILAVKNGDASRITEEAADLLFHILIALEVSGTGLQPVFDELVRRRR